MSAVHRSTIQRSGLLYIFHARHVSAAGADLAYLRISETAPSSYRLVQSGPAQYQHGASSVSGDSQSRASGHDSLVVRGMNPSLRDTICRWSNVVANHEQTKFGP